MGSKSNTTTDPKVEEDLLLDRLVYGTSFYKIVDGRKVRIAPQDVYFKPKWWGRLWYWLRSLFRG